LQPIDPEVAPTASPAKAKAPAERSIPEPTTVKEIEKVADPLPEPPVLAVPDPPKTQLPESSPEPPETQVPAVIHRVTERIVMIPAQTPASHTLKIALYILLSLQGLILIGMLLANLVFPTQLVSNEEIEQAFNAFRQFHFLNLGILALFILGTALILRQILAVPTYPESIKEETRS
jgi:hypothetical protein